MEKKLIKNLCALCLALTSVTSCVQGDFYEMYVGWCRSEDITPVKSKNLDERLRSLGLEVDRKGFVPGRTGIYTIRGLRARDTS